MSISFGVTPITPADLLGRLEDWVKTKVPAIPADCVFLSLAPDDLHLKFPPADQFITIYPSRFPPWQSVVTGAGTSYFTNPGEEHLGFDSEVIMTIFNRFNIDQEIRASQLIRSASLGMMGVFAALLGAIQFWTAPTDADPNVSYLREYMRISGPAQTLPRNYKETFWSLVKIPFEMRFSAKIG